MDTIVRIEENAVGEAFALRPGVLMPEWSLVTDPTAREALAASMTAAGRAEKWSGLDVDEDRVWQAVLRGFARTGQAPGAAELMAKTGLDEPAIAGLLRSLQRRDLIVLDGSTAAVTAAYPFGARETGHRVRLGHSPVAVNTLCAIDALGAGAMLGRDASIESSCRECDAPIRIVTRDAGRAVASAVPATAVVWSGIRYADGCCATSGCTAKVFFCSHEHLAAWRVQSDPDGVGFGLSLKAALQVALGLFVPMLATRPCAEGP